MKFQMPKTTNAVDAIGEINEAIAALEAAKDKLEKKLTKKVGVNIGLKFRAKIFDMNASWLDHGKVERRLGPALYKSCFRSKTVRVVRVTAIKEE